MPGLHCVAGALLFLSPIAVAAQGLWPAGRSGHHMVWHERLQQTLLYGATDDSAATKLWAWTGARWEILATGGPSPRSQFAMTFDANRDRIVLHGGSLPRQGAGGPRLARETWEWDRRGWRLVDSGGPVARDHHAMAYDPARRQVILFGGSDSAGTLLNDTWSWDGRRWARVATEGPPARSTHRLAVDTRRGVIVLFGGFGERNALLNDTWEWNGSAWRQVATPTAPSARFATRLAYDITRQRVVLFGGRSGATNHADTWEFDGLAWTRRDVAGPVMRNVHEMSFDRRENRVLLFGGFNRPVHLDDFWAYDGAWKQIARPDAAPAGRALLARGPHAVGYRVIDHRDATRRTAPARDFEGRANPGDLTVPMQVSIWYPAEPGGTPMRLGEYAAISARSETLGPITEADIAASTSRFRTGLALSHGLDIPQRTADSIRDSRVLAVRDATPATGRFPIVVGGLSGPLAAHGIAEYLASHGYVVVSAPNLSATAGQEVTRRAVAMETYTRNMETAQAIASALPFVDHGRVGLIGSGPHAIAALMHQMRNMSADAIVSLDGQELPAGSATVLRESPYFDPARIRVPYLAFAQANPPTPALVFSDSLVRELRYAERTAYVVKDMDHVALITSQMIYPQLRAEQRLGYDFVYRTVRSFLDGALKGDTAGRAFMRRTPAQNGYPAWLVESALTLPALAPIPNAEEVEAIAMAGNVARLREIHRRARAVDSTARVFTITALNLYAFRFGARGDRETAIAFQELATEAFPASALAANNLGNAYRDAGRTALALQWWEKALTLVDGDPEITPATRAASRTAIEQKIRAMRPPL